MMRQRSIGALCLLATFAMGAERDCRAEDAQEIKIGILHAKLRFDIEQFQVKPGARVRLTFSNTDEMQHNLLILAPSRDDANVMKVAQNAWALGPDAVKKQFVPDGPEVLFHTRVLDPQQSDTITFSAPQNEGDYPYVCTLPGHAFSMKGKMRVSKADGPAPVAAKPTNTRANALLIPSSVRRNFRRTSTTPSRNRWSRKRPDSSGNRTRPTHLQNRSPNPRLIRKLLKAK